MCVGFFLMKLQVSILPLYWEKGVQHYFSPRILQDIWDNSFTEHLYATASNLQKYFTNKLQKNIWKKAKIGKKNNGTRRKTLKHYMTQVFISVYYSKISFFLFLLLPMIYLKLVFLEKMQSHWRFIYYRKWLRKK